MIDIWVNRYTERKGKTSNIQEKIWYYGTLLHDVTTDLKETARA